MNHLEARALWGRTHDGESSADERELLATHLAACEECTAWVARAARLDDSLADRWEPLKAPAGFTRTVEAQLPARPVRQRSDAVRWLSAVAASLAIVVLLGLLTQPAAVASLGLFLRQVVLRESPPPPITLSAPLRRVTLAEAQAELSWRIREPSALPPGYRLVGVFVGEIHTFALGPTVWLQYAPDTTPSAPYLAVVEVRARTQVDEPVAQGNARNLTLPDGRGALFIEGRWREGSDSAWETGNLLRLIVEDEEEGLVIQLQADPRDGWTEAMLVEAAASLR